MKSIILIICFVFSKIAFTQVNSEGWLNLNQACRDKISNNTCHINENGIKVTLRCTAEMKLGSDGTVFCHSGQSPLIVESMIPIREVHGSNLSRFDSSKNIVEIGSSNVGMQTVSVKDSFSFQVTGGYSYPNLSFIRFSYGAGDGLTASLKASGVILHASYNNALTAANLFKTEIAKTHRNHMTRFMTTLQEGISLLNPNATERVSIVDWRVQENARLIVVFGTIMNELLTDYDDVERLKLAIKTISNLVGELRVSYGWERGLAGNVSRASSALLQVVRLEIQELASIKLAMGDSNLAIYSNLLRTSGQLLAKVNGSKSGDMKAQREIYDFVDSWNSTEFQAELNRLMNAGPDFKNLVVPKLTMLLKAVESINDLADAGMIIPQDKTKK